MSAQSRQPGYDHWVAVPYGFKGWQEYLNKHIAQCGDWADYYQGDGQFSIEGKATRSGSPRLSVGRR